MSAEPLVTQREYDQFVKTTERDIEQLRADRDQDIKTAVAAAVAAAIKERNEERSTSWVRRFGAIAATGGLVSAFITLMQLWHSSGR